MLQSLTINNIALINNLTIDLSNGFNVLTGETGAGKSLIIDSIALLLGEKADKGLISYGENFASVEAVFETSSEEVLSKLEEFGLERESTIIIYRKLSRDGKNECRVNGKSFTLSMLKALTSPLMDLHGQFQHQELLKEEYQLQTLDNFGGTEILKYICGVKIYIDIKKRILTAFTSNEDSTIINLKTYNYELYSVKDLNLQPCAYKAPALTDCANGVYVFGVLTLKKDFICTNITLYIGCYRYSNYDVSVNHETKIISPPNLDFCLNL